MAKLKLATRWKQIFVTDLESPYHITFKAAPLTARPSKVQYISQTPIQDLSALEQVSSVEEVP